MPAVATDHRPQPELVCVLPCMPVRLAALTHKQEFYSMSGKADPTRDRVVESQSIAEQLRAFRDEALGQLAEAGWPIDRLETLEDLERLSVWAGLTPTERDRMTMDEVCRHAMYVSERRQIERSHRIAEQVVAARKIRQWACQDATGDQGDTTISDTPQAAAGDTIQDSNQRRPRVELKGADTAPVVDGSERPILTESQFRVVTSLIEAGGRITGDVLKRRSGCGDAVNILKRLAEKPYWRDVILLSGNDRNGYGIRSDTPPKES